MNIGRKVKGVSRTRQQKSLLLKKTTEGIVKKVSEGAGKVVAEEGSKKIQEVLIGKRPSGKTLTPKSKQMLDDIRGRPWSSSGATREHVMKNKMVGPCYFWDEENEENEEKKCKIIFFNSFSFRTSFFCYFFIPSNEHVNQKLKAFGKD